jgi:hypothetical protein
MAFAGGRDKLSVSVDVVNNTELQANAQQVLTSSRVARPMNTTRAYTPKQREFKVGTCLIR